MELGLGLGWGSYFAHNTWHFDLAATYDFHVFWGENVMRAFRDLVSNVEGTPGNLFMHGLTLTTRFDF
jgi:hypothetical protein